MVATAFCVMTAASAEARGADLASTGPLPLVVILMEEESNAFAAGLFEALQIRLTGRARLQQGQQPRSGNLPERLSSARALARKLNAGAVLWLESLDDEPELVLYAATPDMPQALVESLAIKDVADVERPRVLALKLAELLEMAFTRNRDWQESQKQAQPVRGNTIAVSTEVVQRGVFQPFAELSSAVTKMDSGLRPGLRIAGGVVFGTQNFVEVMLSGNFLAEENLQIANARADMGQQGLAMGTRAVFSSGGWRWGGGAELGVRRISVSASSTDGRLRDTILYAPTISAAIELRRSLWRNSAVRLAAGVARTLSSRKLTLDGTPAHTMGGLEPQIFLGIVVGQPEAP